MQSVSTDFLKSIKNDNREIHGYVEVIYDAKNILDSYSITNFPLSSNLSMQDGSDIIDGVRVMKNYATLENNYFLLDGSFMIANANTLYDSKGFVSEDIYNNISDKSITINKIENGMSTKGFTIFFKDNIAFDFNVQITTDDDAMNTIRVRNNTSSHYQVIFEDELTIDTITLTILNVEYPDRRIRIPDISFGLVDLYQGDELVSFDVNEEVDIYDLSIPINTCTVNINNYPDENGNTKFDPLSPTGITPYLTNNVEIKPHIGVLTEMNAVEYVDMGIYYLKDWSSDSDGNVTLNGVSGMEKIKNTMIDNNNDDIFLGRYFYSGVINQLNQQLTNMTGFKFNIICPTILVNVNINYTTLEKWLFTVLPFLSFQKYTDMFDNPIYSKKIFHINRKNEVNMDNITDIASFYKISRNNLLNDVKYIQNTPINKFNVSYSREFVTDQYINKEDLLKVPSYSLKTNTEYVWYKLDKRPSSPMWPNEVGTSDYNYKLTYTKSGNGKVEVIDGNMYMAYLKYTGEPGETFSDVTINGYIQATITDTSGSQYSFTNDSEVGDTISISFENTAYVSSNRAEDTAYYYLYENRYNYNVQASTMGDPSIECGDKISIQTKYTNNEEEGYKDIIVTKQHFKYDGGLTCDLEGVGN